MRTEPVFYKLIIINNWGFPAAGHPVMSLLSGEQSNKEIVLRTLNLKENILHIPLIFLTNPRLKQYYHLHVCY